MTIFQDDGIIIVERRQTADNGETVVAKINGDQVTLKRFYIEADGIRLQPAHPTWRRSFCVIKRSKSSALSPV